jgi:hypothetical protein
MAQQPTNSPNQGTSINIHQQRLYSLILGALGLLGIILPWLTQQGFNGGSTSVNGFQSWGILSLFGVVGVLVSSLAGDKTKPYDQNMKYLAIGSFSAITLGAFIYFMQVSGNSNAGMLGTSGPKSGIGLWFCIIGGVLGILWSSGVIKFSPPSNTHPPTPPPPPPPSA